MVNGERKEKIKPIHGKHTVVIDGCQENTKYTVLVVGIPKSDSERSYFNPFGPKKKKEVLDAI